MTLAPTSNQDAIATTTVVSYPGPTLVQVHASGTVHLWAQPGNIDKGDMGAGGVHSPNSGSCTGNVYITNGANFIGFCAPQDNPQPPRDPWDTTYVVNGDVNVGWVTGPMSGGTETFTNGPFVVTITPVSVDYNVTANPTTLNYNDTVTVTATVSPSQVNGLNVPWQIDSTTWAPAFGTQGSPCAYDNWVVVDAGTQKCRKPFTRSGTLTVYATVDGTKQSNAFSITVTPPTLKVTASPSTIQGPQHVTFTATATPSTITWSLSGQGWYWMPDHPPDNNYFGNCTWQTKTCNPVVGRSGWMKATATIGEYPLADSVYVTVNSPTLTVTASPSAIANADSVTFTASVTPSPAVAWNLTRWTWTPDSGTGGISADCQWNNNPCKRVISKSGAMTAVTTIGEYTLTASAHVSVGVTVSITVTTYTPPASFTANSPENVITLHASVVPSTLASRTQWQVQAHPDHYPQPPLPGTLTGADASFSVTPLTADRWPTYHPTALALAPKQLGYRITASVIDDAGQTHVSNSADAVQDEMDTMREEYVELNVFRGVPGRTQFSPQAPSFPGINSGDYNFMVFNNSFVGALNNLFSAWSGQWQLNSEYRNPVHQWFHVPDGDHTSWHQYGCAADLQTFPVGPSNAADSASAWDFWHRLADLARGQAFGVEDSLSSGIGHVHVQQPC